MEYFNVHQKRFQYANSHVDHDLDQRALINSLVQTQTADMFPLNDHAYETRHPEKFQVTHAITNRMAKSSIPYMQRLLNNQFVHRKFLDHIH